MDKCNANEVIHMERKENLKLKKTEKVSNNEHGILKSVIDIIKVDTLVEIAATNKNNQVLLVFSII